MAVQQRGTAAGPDRPAGRARLVRVVALTTVAGALGIGLVTACGSSGMSGGSAPSTPSAGVTAGAASANGSMIMADSATMIHIASFRYQVPASVAPGATVSVMNMDGEAHTVTSDRGGAFAVTAPAGATVTFTAPSKPGSYPFHCIFHADMHGVLVVK